MKVVIYKRGQRIGAHGCRFVREVDRRPNPNGGYRRRAEFRCRCGALFCADISNVKCGAVRSCGCLVVESIYKRCTKHGESPAGGGTRLYRFWQSMKDRCLNPRSSSFRHYGGRGITVHEPWANSFWRFRKWFVKTTGELNIPPGRSMDRVDNDGPYAPGNLRLATLAEQANNRRNNHYLMFQGRKMTLAQVARAVGMRAGTLWSRLMIQKKTLEEAVK